MMSPGASRQTAWMSKDSAGRSRRAAVRYGIVVAGEIGPPGARPLEGMTTERLGEESMISAVFSDEARLVGLINWLHDKGIEIVSIGPLESGVAG